MLLYRESMVFNKKQYVISSPTNKKLNILLLGATGLGKSTWINGFANYLTYPNLNEAAANSGGISLIPTSFRITDVNQIETVISTGPDENENHEDGESATQFPKTYRFSYDDVTVRLIDTPGFGETCAIEQDKENFNNILTHIARYNKLNGICILLKPNDSRLDGTFQYCIKELLTNLHKDYYYYYY